MANRQETTTTRELPARKLAPVRFVDVGTAGQVRTGGYTVVGGGSSGLPETIVNAEGLTKEQAVALEAQRKAQAIAEAQAKAKAEEEARIKAEQEAKIRAETTAERKLQPGEPQQVEQKSWAEENVIARTKSGKVSIPGSISKSFWEFSDWASEKTGYKEWAKDKPIWGWQVERGKLITGTSELLTWGFFSPAFASTATIQRGFSSGVTAYKGTAKTIPGTKIIKTKVQFIKQVGGKLTPGEAVGYTYGKTIGEDVTAGVTLGAGRTVGRAIKFPSGKIITVAKDKFTGVTGTIAKEVGEGRFVAVTKGVIQTAKGEGKFSAINIGRRLKEQTIALGRTATERGKDFTFGVIKRGERKIEDVGTRVGVIGRAGRPSVPGEAITKTIQKQTPISGVQEIVSASVSEAPLKEVGKSIVKRGASVGVISSIAPQKTITAPATTVTVKELPAEKLAPKVVVDYIEETKTDQVQVVTPTTALPEKQITPTVPVVTPVVITPQIIPTQTTPSRPITPGIDIPLVPSPYRPFGFPVMAFGGERAFFGGKVPARRTYKYTPSFKAIAFGITKVGKVPKPSTKFTGLELRPIIKKRKKRKKK